MGWLFSFGRQKLGPIASPEPLSGGSTAEARQEGLDLQQLHAGQLFRPSR